MIATLLVSSFASASEVRLESNEQGDLLVNGEVAMTEKTMNDVYKIKKDDQSNVTINDSLVITDELLRSKYGIVVDDQGNVTLGNNTIDQSRMYDANGVLIDNFSVMSVEKGTVYGIVDLDGAEIPIILSNTLDKNKQLVDVDEASICEKDTTNIIGYERELSTYDTQYTLSAGGVVMRIGGVAIGYDCADLSREAYGYLYSDIEYVLTDSLQEWKDSIEFPFKIK